MILLDSHSNQRTSKRTTPYQPRDYKQSGPFSQF